MSDLKLPSRIDSLGDKDGEEEREERFDYTDNELIEPNNSMLTMSGSPRRIKPWSFMDSFNPKKQALALARELDAQSGVRLELAQKPEVSTSDGLSDGHSSQSTIRRVPSGAKPSSNGHAVRAAIPVESDCVTSGNTNEQAISDVAGQSTPLTLAKIANNQGKSQGGDSKSLSTAHLTDVTFGDLRKETDTLRDEISRLKNQVLKQEEIHLRKENELKKASQSLADKNMELESLNKLLPIKESDIVTLSDQLDEMKRLLDFSEKNRLLNNDAHASTIKDLREEINRKNDLIDQAKSESQRIEEKMEKRIEKLEATIDDLKDKLDRERENAFDVLRTTNSNWQKKVDEKEEEHKLSINKIESEYDREISRLQEELNKKTEDFESLESNFKEKCAELELKVQNLKESRKIEDEVRLECNITKERLKDAEKFNERLENSMKAARTEFETESNSLKAKIAEAETTNELLKNNVTTLKVSLDDFQGQNNDLKEILASTEKINEDLKRALEALKMSQNETHLEKNQLKEKLTDAEKSYRSLKGNFIQAAKEADELKSKHKKLQKSLEEESLAHEKTSKKLREVETYSDNLSTFVENLTLFDIHLGDVMMHTFNKDHHVTCLDPFFSGRIKEIIGFYTKHDDRKHGELEKRLDTLTITNQNLKSQIENQWKAKVETQAQELLQEKAAHSALEAKLRDLEEKSKDFETRFENSQKEKAIMLKEKENLLREQLSINDKITLLKSSSLNEDHKKVEELVDKIEQVTRTITQIREQIKLGTEENGKLRASLEVKDLKLADLQKTCSEQERKLVEKNNFIDSQNKEFAELRRANDKQVAELKEATTKLKWLKGDESRKITFEVACQSRPDINRVLYDRLMIDKVDLIDVVELQNIVKNLILLLEIPFNKLTKKGPLVAIYLKYERPIFSHFANRLHYELFNEAIDMKRFTNEAFDQYTEAHNMAKIKHPLEVCLENLYQKLLSRI